MAMKELFFENPMSIKNGVNQPKHRAHNAIAKNQGTGSYNVPDEPIPNSVIKRQSVPAKKLSKIS